MPEQELISKASLCMLTDAQLDKSNMQLGNLINQDLSRALRMGGHQEALGSWRRLAKCAEKL